MKDNIEDYFSGIETEKRKALLTLMDEWRDSLADKEFAEFFNMDGFFPNYYEQKHKVLFVGREARWVTADEGNISDDIVNCDYIDFYLGCLKRDKQKNNSFWGRILRIMQLFISDGKKEYEDLANDATDYAIEMAVKGEYSFAIMNISKYCNDTKEGGKADYYSINRFLEDSQLEKRNFFQEELKILDPDYIITFYLWNGKIKTKYLDLCFGVKTPLDEYPKTSPDGRLYEIDLIGKKVKLVDIYHPSTPSRVKPDDRGCFYTPIKELLFPVIS